MDELDVLLKLKTKLVSSVDYVTVLYFDLLYLISFHIFELNELYSGVPCSLNFVFKISGDIVMTVKIKRNLYPEYAEWDAGKVNCTYDNKMLLAIMDRTDTYI